MAPTLKNGVLLCIMLLGCSDQTPEKKAESAADAVIEIKPKYWACTSAYVSYHREYCHSGKLRHCHDAYSTCECNQWTAYMVGKEHPKDAECRDGWKPEPLKDVVR
jgi:hypothetical protein